MCSTYYTDIASAKKILYKYGNGIEESIEWTIQSENERIEFNMMAQVAPIPYKQHVSSAKTPSQNFFDLFFPQLTGLSLVLDDFSRDPAYGVDPDAKLKQAVMMLIAAANEV